GIVAYTFAHIQHPHGLTWDKEPFQSTLYVRGQSPFRRLMFGQEEHIIHHLTPHVPWFKYKRVWDLANGVLRKQGIPARGWFEGPGEIALPAPDARLPQVLKVGAVTDDAAGVRVIRFEPPAGQALTPAEAGAHVDIHLDQGTVRQYSLIEAEPDHYTIAVRRDDKGRGGSRAMHELAVGDSVLVGKPRNNFVLYESAQRFILVAGGIGITPMLSMARRLLAIGKPFELHLCARDAASAPLLAHLTQGPLADLVTVHFDNPDGSASCDFSALLARRDAGTMLYLCGPQGFMDALRQTALAQGWDKNAIRVENFGAAIVEEADQVPFTVRLGRSDREVAVRADESIIDALARSGVDVPFACMQGTCGTCVTPVLEGEVAHRDAFLSEEDKARMDCMCLCVSRARNASLTVDL
ncbi:MAG TPA: 2Fe-2S iron-sulfur cluster-binding protein, partial [Novosphingobium sp.]|nr:2Fe-2S iron-sulfur cluster-binding protein [Novosphingobium sp.]